MISQRYTTQSIAESELDRFGKLLAGFGQKYSIDPADWQDEWAALRRKMTGTRMFSEHVRQRDQDVADADAYLEKRNKEIRERNAEYDRRPVY